MAKHNNYKYKKNQHYSIHTIRTGMQILNNLKQYSNIVYTVIWIYSFAFSEGNLADTGAKGEISRRIYSILCESEFTSCIVTATLARPTMGFPWCI